MSRVFILTSALRPTSEASGAVQEALELALQGNAESLPGGLESRGAAQDNDVEIRLAGVHASEMFPGEAFHEIALDGPGEMLLRNRKAQAVSWEGVGSGEEQHFSTAGFGIGRCKYPPVVAAAQQPVRARKNLTHGSGTVIKAANRLAQAARRLRPRARRRASTARPLFVAMRARKPWVRLRLSTLG